MAGGIFAISGDTLVELRETPYEAESVLQRLLADHPQLLAMDGESDQARWLLVRRELGVPDGQAAASRWSVDHLFVDQNAVPTLVEVKRSDDNRIRREVVGQMLDYAANGVVYWPADKLRAEFQTRCIAEGADPEAVFRASLGDELDIDQFWADVEQNLRSGRIRLTFVADVIPPELRRVIEFLNEHMTPTEIVGVEIRQYVGAGGITTLVPRFIGQTEEARVQKLGSGRASSTDVEWDHYQQTLPADRLAIVCEIYTRMETAIADRNLPWLPKLKASYLGFARPGPYHCCGITLRKTGPIEFWIKLPADPETLRSTGTDVTSLYPQLNPHWDAHNKQMTWTAATIEQIPDLSPAISITSRFQPNSGPMQPVPASPSDNSIG